MKDRVLRAAVIGTGQIAVQHLQALAASPHATVAAVCDLSPAMAELASERFGVPAFFTDHERLLKEVRPDVVHVTTPPASHFPLAKAALEAGCHVLLEKPATLQFAQLEDLQRIADESDRVLIEDHNYLFNKSIQRIGAAIEAGELGEIVRVDVSIDLGIYGEGSLFADRNAPHPLLKLPGGVVFDFLTHMAYFVYAFLGPHERVAAMWTLQQGGDHPVPLDTLSATVETSCGTARLAFSGVAQPDRFEVCVHGTKGRLSSNLFETGVTRSRVFQSMRPLTPVRNGVSTAIGGMAEGLGGLRRKLAGGAGAYEGLWTLICRMYESLAEEGDPPVASSQVREVNRLVHDLLATVPVHGREALDVSGDAQVA